MAEISLKEINDRVKGTPIEMIDLAEIRYHDFVKEVADRVTKDDKIRIVFLAGPSGSGKTTTAKLLSQYITERGFECRVVSLDDFYRDAADELYPKQESGERDYEALEALNIPDLNETLNDIAEGRDYILPHYDFTVAARVSEENCSKITHGCVVIEGIHALNPAIFTKLPSEKVLKVFISVSTNIYNNGEVLISGRKMRFARRMVRDSIFRASDAQRTLSMWSNVLRGEEKYLYPNRIYADISFDTFHAFELSLLKPYVLNLISPELASKDDFASTVLSAYSLAEPIDSALVPDDSLMREFFADGSNGCT